MRRSGVGRKLIQRAPRVEAALWRRFVFEDDDQCKTRLFNKYRKLAAQIAKKKFFGFPRGNFDIGDFEQAAYVGLLDAIERYDPLRHVPFSAFARLSINGAIAEGYGKSSEVSAIYRYRRRQMRDRARAIHNDSQSHKSNALDDLSALVKGLAIGLILDQFELGEDGEVIDPEPSAYETLAWKELRQQVMEAIIRLPGTERSVLCQHYLSGLPFKQIAQLLGLTPGRISQLHKSGLRRLQSLIGKLD